MTFSLKKWIERIKFMVILVIMTYLISLLLQMVSAWIEPTQRYKEPSGKAVKAIQQQDVLAYDNSIKDRLLFFYWYGE